MTTTSITLEIGSTRLNTDNAALALHVLQQEAGPTQSLPIHGEEISYDEFLTPPRIGTHWQGKGGTYAGIIRGVNGQPDYHLIAPKHTQIDSIIYGGAGYEVASAKCPRDGLANTKALLALDIEHPAARWAAEQESEGHTDLYLPSRAEAYLCWANIPEQFQGSAWWITSTQLGPNGAWIQGFADGGQHLDRKDNARPAFAVRRILILNHFNLD